MLAHHKKEPMSRPERKPGAQCVSAIITNLHDWSLKPPAQTETEAQECLDYTGR